MFKIKYVVLNCLMTKHLFILFNLSLLLLIIMIIIIIITIILMMMIIIIIIIFLLLPSVPSAKIVHEE